MINPEFARTIWNMYNNSNVRVASGRLSKIDKFIFAVCCPGKDLSENVYEVNLSGVEWNKSILRYAIKTERARSLSIQFFELINISVRPTYSLSLNVTF